MAQSAGFPDTLRSQCLRFSSAAAALSTVAEHQLFHESRTARSSAPAASNTWRVGWLFLRLPREDGASSRFSRRDMAPQRHGSSFTIGRFICRLSLDTVGSSIIDSNISDPTLRPKRLLFSIFDSSIFISDHLRHSTGRLHVPRAFWTVWFFLRPPRSSMA